jgi:DNA-binding MarR family transcriptional regulator
MHLHPMYMHGAMKAPKPPRKSLRADARTLIETCAGWNSRLAARRITLFLDRELAGVGMTVSQLGLMAQIATLADDTMGELANRTGLEQSTLSRNLRTLEAQGLIEIAVVEADLRRRAVWLTEAGARRLEAAIPIWRRAHARLAECISPRRVRELADATQRLSQV